MMAMLKSVLVATTVIAVSGSMPIKWSLPPQQVPKSSTTLSPALTLLGLTAGKSETVLFYAGPAAAKAGFQISDQVAESVSHDKWTAPALVAGGALTDQRPSAAQLGAGSPGQSIVTWAGAGDQKVWYAIGAVGKTGKLSWPHPAASIPGARTSAGPTVFSPILTDAVFVTWPVLGSHRVDYVIGKIIGSTVAWGSIKQIPVAQAASAATVTEVAAGSAGRIYVFWRNPAGRIAGAWTSDPLKSHQAWTIVHSAITTNAAPAATAIGATDGYPVLVAYRSAKKGTLSYAELNAGGSLIHKSGWTVPALHSGNGPALIPGLLAATDPGAVDYLPFVRVCAGC
jgi:hypothetical protein